MQINLFFNKLRAVWQIFASEVLYQVRYKNWHHVSKLYFVEFFYTQIVITLFLNLLLSNARQYVLFGLKLGVHTRPLMNFRLLLLLFFIILTYNRFFRGRSLEILVWTAYLGDLAFLDSALRSKFFIRVGPTHPRVPGLPLCCLLWHTYNARFGSFSRAIKLA